MVTFSPSVVYIDPSAAPVIRIAGYLTEQELEALERSWKDEWRAYTSVTYLPINQLDLTVNNILEVPEEEFKAAFSRKDKGYADHILEIARKEAA